MRRLGLALLLASASGAGAAPLTLAAHRGTVYQTAKAGAATEAFLEIDNAGGADTLTGIACPIAGSSGLVGANDAALANLPVPAGEALRLRPDGPHIELRDTHFSIAPGSAIPCSLEFQNSGKMLVYLYAVPAP